MDLPDVGERWMRAPETGKGKMIKGVQFSEWQQMMLTERERSASSGQFGANLEYVRSRAFLDKLKRDARTAKISEAVASAARHILQHLNGTPYEDYYLLDSETGATLAVSNKAIVKKGVSYNAQVKKAL